MYPTDIADWTLDCCDPQPAPAPTVVARVPTLPPFASTCPACGAQGHDWLCPDCMVQVAADLAEIEMDLARRLAG